MLGKSLSRYIRSSVKDKIYKTLEDNAEAKMMIRPTEIIWRVSYDRKNVLEQAIIDEFKRDPETRNNNGVLDGLISTVYS